jgi:high-affinity nickel permease
VNDSNWDFYQFGFMFGMGGGTAVILLIILAHLAERLWKKLKTWFRRFRSTV